MKTLEENIRTIIYSNILDPEEKIYEIMHFVDKELKKNARR